jgi:hypothetical protein
MELAASLEKNCSGEIWDWERVRGVTQEQKARFLVLSGAFRPAAAPLFQRGVFSVHAVP